MIPRILTLAAAGLVGAAAWTATSAAGPWPVVAIGLAAAATAAARPAAGLMLVAAFAPLGGAVAALAGLRISGTEPLLLAVLAGWLARRTVCRESWDPLTVGLAGIFALVVLTSLLAQAVLAVQITSLERVSFSRALVEVFTPGGPTRVALGPQVTAAWRLVGGLGLFVMAVEVGRRHADVAAGSLRLLTLGAAAVAALNISRFVEIVLSRGGDWLPTAIELHRVVRISSTVTDVNAAGAMFALVLPAAAAMCMRPRWRAIGVLALTSLGAGLWLTGSRAAMVGAAVGLTACLAQAAGRYWTRRQAVVGVVLLLVTLAGVVVWYPRGAAHTAAGDAWLIRKYLASASLSMARESPAFGVGIGRFRAESPRFAPEGLQRYYHAENAHNQVLQLLGELGIPGAALFLALLGCSLLPGWRGASAPTTETFRASVALGLLAWLLASVLMHPLLVPEASAAFWLALGAARSVAAAASPDRRARRWEIAVSTMVVVALFATVPARTTAARKALDLEGVGVGLTKWRTDRDGHRYRRAAGNATIYVDSRADRIRIPLRARGPRSTVLDVQLLLEGRPAGRVAVPTGAWTEVAMQLPAPDARRPRFQRLDFRWTMAPRSAVRLDIGRHTDALRDR